MSHSKVIEFTSTRLQHSSQLYTWILQARVEVNGTATTPTFIVTYNFPLHTRITTARDRKAQLRQWWCNMALCHTNAQTHSGGRVKQMSHLITLAEKYYGQSVWVIPSSSPSLTHSFINSSVHPSPLSLVTLLSSFYPSTFLLYISFLILHSNLFTRPSFLYIYLRHPLSVRVLRSFPLLFTSRTFTLGLLPSLALYLWPSSSLSFLSLITLH